MSRSRRSTHRRLVGAVAGVALDRLAGEIPDQVHPLRGFGALMGRVEARTYRDDLARGVLYAMSGIATGTLAGLVLRSTTLAVYLAWGGRSLAEASGAVEDALARGDLPAARAAATALVSRDVAILEDKELARAAVESVAENTVDAMVAPLLYALVAGAPGALAYRCLNTLDALVGYRNPRYGRFGWASARLDDLANFVPARLTALLVALVRPRRAGDVLRVVRRDAPGHPSPNAGVAESAFAAALALRLGGANSYGGVVEARPEMGDGRSPEAGDISRAVRLSCHVGNAAALAALLAAVALRPRAHLGRAGGRGR